MHPRISIEHQDRGSSVVHLLVKNSEGEFDTYNLCNLVERTAACSAYQAVTVIAYIDAARKNMVACPARAWYDACLPPPRYTLSSSAMPTMSDVEDAVARFIRANTYVREVMGGGRVDFEEDEVEDGDDEDMPALEPFTTY
ncbi:hypothetical protein PENSPDRAFT_695427 [Peniophora sp. CONT]|nr:hypothetical protein PENSPDRAFT_695427 [Peniophora sp. CONT]